MIKKKLCSLVISLATAASLTTAFLPAAYADGTIETTETTETAENSITVGDVEYTSLETAVRAAKPGQTITLLKDLDMTDRTGQYNILDISGTTLDLNNKTIKWNNAAFVIQGKDAIVKNGIFDGNGGSYALFIGNDDNSTGNFVVEDVIMKGGVNIYNTESVVLRDVNVEGTKYYAIWCDENAHATIESGTYKSHGYAVIGMSKTETELLIYDGTFISGDNNKMILPGGYNKPTIYGGKFNKVENLEYTALAQGYRFVKNDDYYEAVKAEPVTMGESQPFYTVNSTEEKQAGRYFEYTETVDPRVSEAKVSLTSEGKIVEKTLSLPEIAGGAISLRLLVLGAPDDITGTIILE